MGNDILECCGQCGVQVVEGADFCGNCGEAIVAATVPQAHADGVVLSAKGVNGQIDLFRDKIVIRRKGFRAFMTQGLKGEKDIYLSRISSVQYKKPGLVTNGYLQFTFSGGKETKGGLFDATRDENTVMFTKAQQAAFGALKERIETGLNTPAAQPVTSSGLDDLEKLASLRDKGIITAEDFETKKRQILGL